MKVAQLIGEKGRIVRDWRGLMVVSCGSQRPHGHVIPEDAVAAEESGMELVAVSPSRRSIRMTVFRKAL